MEHCIECNQELEIRLNAFVCTYPSCPLKGLLQVGVENLPEEKPKRWKPRKGNEFFSIYTDGAIEQYIWEGSEYDNQIHQFGNCFKTREEAELMRDKIRDLLNQ